MGGQTWSCHSWFWCIQSGEWNATPSHALFHSLHEKIFGFAETSPPLSYPIISRREFMGQGSAKFWKTRQDNSLVSQLRSHHYLRLCLFQRLISDGSWVWTGFAAEKKKERKGLLPSSMPCLRALPMHPQQRHKSRSPLPHALCLNGGLSFKHLGLASWWEGQDV